jgi:hypothetical protein
MATLRSVLAGAAMAICALGGSAASAATVLVSDVGVYNSGSWNQVTIGSATEYSVGILFNNDFLVFCVDLEHNIGVTHYDPALVFTTGYLEYNGAGIAVSESVSNRIGQLAGIGRHLVSIHAPDYINQLSAIQAAIWSLEYNRTATFSDGLSYLNADVTEYLTIADNGRGRARSLIAHAPGVTQGVQNMVTGVVPEPMSWVLMIGGFGMTGAMIRRRRALAVPAIG